MPWASRREPVSASTFARWTSTIGIGGAAASAWLRPSGRQAASPRTTASWTPCAKCMDIAITSPELPAIAKARRLCSADSANWPVSNVRAAYNRSRCHRASGNADVRASRSMAVHAASTTSSRADRYAAWSRHSCPINAVSGCPSTSARSVTRSPSRIRSAVSSGCTRVISRACAASISAIGSPLRAASASDSRASASAWATRPESACTVASWASTRARRLISRRGYASAR